MKKYLLFGALVFSLSTPVFAQEQGNDYKAAVTTIIDKMEAEPNNPKAVKSLIKQYLKAFKKDEKALLALGNAYLSQRNYPEAKKVASLIINNKKLNGTCGYLLLGDIAALEDSIGNAGAAAQQYQLAIESDPKNIDAYIRYAKIYRYIDFDVAINKLKEIRNYIPDYPIEPLAADIALSVGKYDVALNWYTQVDKSKLAEEDYYKYSFIAFTLQKYDKSIEVVKEGLSKYNNSEYIARVGMMAATAKGDYSDAIDYGKLVFAGKGTKVANDYAIYGKALYGNKQFDEALKSLNKALEIDKKNFEPMKTIADVYAAQGDDDKALEIQKDYLSKNPNANSNDWSKLAQTYVDKAIKITDTTAKNATLDKAIAVYEEMISKFPSISDWIWLNQATAAYAKNDPDLVAKIYNKIAAYEEAKSSLTADDKQYLEQVYYGLGYYHSKKGNKELANEYFKKVLSINPDNQNAKNALGK